MNHDRRTYVAIRDLLWIANESMSTSGENLDPAWESSEIREAGVQYMRDNYVSMRDLEGNANDMLVSGAIEIADRIANEAAQVLRDEPAFDFVHGALDFNSVTSVLRASVDAVETFRDRTDERLPSSGYSLDETVSTLNDAKSVYRIAEAKDPDMSDEDAEDLDDMIGKVVDAIRHAIDRIIAEITRIAEG